MKTKNVLLEFGLTSRQADIYLILRSKGSQTMLELSKASGIPRATLYGEIERMKRLAVVGAVTKNRRQFLEAKEPDSLLHQLKARLASFEASLPILEAIAPIALEGSKFEYFVGYEESKQAQKKFYRSLEIDKVSFVKSFGHPDLAKAFPKFVPLMIEKRRQMGISTQLIVPAGKRREIPHYFDGGGKREMRFMPPRFEFNCNCVIGGTHILFIVTNSDELTVVLMKSKSISGLLSACHSLIWDLVGETR